MNARWGTGYPRDEILITTGSQQGLDLVGKLFLDEGDEILCESPTYVGAITAWNVFQPRWVEVPTDDEGMIAAELERLLDARAGRSSSMWCRTSRTPPAGPGRSERRRLLMEAGHTPRRSRSSRTIRTERFASRARICRRSRTMDPEGLVISLGTFSKIFCPGLRIGWIAANSEMIGKLVLLKQGADLHTPTLNQMLISASIAAGGFEERIARISTVYRERRDAMTRALEREMPPGVRFTRPDGGLFLWVTLPDA